jgi:hypothetical protein
MLKKKVLYILKNKVYISNSLSKPDGNLKKENGARETLQPSDIIYKRSMYLVSLPDQRQ